MFDDDEDINEEASSSSEENNAAEEEAQEASDVTSETPEVSEARDAAATEFENFDGEEEENKQEEEEQKPDPNTVTVQPVQFASFEDLDQVQGPQNQNLNILLDVKLQLSVELGKAELPIKKVLELTKGSIVTLNKAAGEPVELYANGKLIAFGEVVVIEDNFGLRITHITDPVRRLNTINGGARED